FFQAEDGIRDDLVTGVQTCALPISALSGMVARRGATYHRAIRTYTRRLPTNCRPKISKFPIPIPPFRPQSTGFGQRRSQLALGSCLLYLSRAALSSFGSSRS